MTRITEVRLVKYLRINHGGEVVRDIYTYLQLLKEQIYIMSSDEVVGGKGGYLQRK